jgi:hypothetical protein
MKPYIIDGKCPALQDMCKAIVACSRGAIY